MVRSGRVPLFEASSPGYRVRAVVEDQGFKVAIGLQNRTIRPRGARGAIWAGAGTGVARQMGVIRYAGWRSEGSPDDGRKRCGITAMPAAGTRVRGGKRTGWREISGKPEAYRNKPWSRPHQTRIAVFRAGLISSA